jgi:hypothetical protein
MDNRIEEIFTSVDIDEIWISNDPTNLVFELIERNNRRKGIFYSDPSITMVISEFHINNLIYFKENFLFLNELTSKLLNLFAALINLKDLEPNYNEIFRNKLHEIRIGIESFNLKIDEVAKLLKYIQSSYFPHIKLYHDFCNRERKTETKKIDIIINRPLHVPQMNIAIEHKEEVKHVDADSHLNKNDKIDHSKVN